jgi:dTDP-4-amino-4,6-dideoxygalactose transaminase
MTVQSKSIQVLKPYYRTDEVLTEIRNCLEIGWTGIGFKTNEFEREWCNYTGLKHSHFINSATAGLHLAVEVLKKHHCWDDGDEIITTSLTFVSTNHAILYEKLNPVFADVDISLNMDPESVVNKITSRTRAIIFVGIGGNAANYLEIVAIARKYNLILILDAAHMAGTKKSDTDGLHVGHEADCVVFSFQAVKNCPTSDSGMICFKNQSLDAQARKLSWMGIDKSTFDRASTGTYKWQYSVDELGYKYNGNSVAAAIGLVSLRYLDADNERRRKMAEIYCDELNDIVGIKIISHSFEYISSRHLFQIAVEDRAQLMDQLAVMNIHCGVHYYPNHLYQIYNPFYTKLEYTEYIHSRLLSLPLHLHLSDEDVRFIAKSIRNLTEPLSHSSVKSPRSYLDVHLAA